MNLGGNEISDLSPLAGPVSLTELKLYDNRIVDLSPLAGLIGLTELSLRGNEVEDVAPLADLANLKVLLLADNRIADISPLLDNAGLGEGDRVDLANNPLDMASVDTHAAALSARGIEVRHGDRARSLAAMFPTVADAHRQGFVRIVNRSTQAGEVRIEATDATGPRTAPLTLAVAANETVHLNSNDLEWGNTDQESRRSSRHRRRQLVAFVHQRSRRGRAVLHSNRGRFPHVDARLRGHRRRGVPASHLQSGQQHRSGESAEAGQPRFRGRVGVDHRYRR